MTTKIATTCDQCGSDFDAVHLGWGFHLSSAEVGPVDSRHVIACSSDPLPRGVDLCSFKCLQTFVAKGEPRPDYAGG